MWTPIKNIISLCSSWFLLLHPIWLQEQEYLSFELSLDEDDSKKETIKRVVGTNHYRKKVEKDKEVRVGIKDWLVNSLLYKKY